MLSVGPQRKPFYPHKGVLCEVSSFFRAAFGKQFKEAAEAKMDLPEDIVEVVEDMVKWMYVRNSHHIDTETTKELGTTRISTCVPLNSTVSLRSLIAQR